MACVSLRSWIALSLMLAGVSASRAQESDPRLHADGPGWRLDQARRSDASRPRVLLIGDSILSGYLKTVTAALEGKAYVDAWVNPYHQGSGGLGTKLAQVLAQGPYDVIHFNMGLHGYQPGRIPSGQFEPLTRRLVEGLRAGAPKARLIWASSTPVTARGRPGFLDPEINAIIVDHNRRAAAVMAEMGLPINDLYAALANRLELARGDQFHWTAPAYVLLGEHVTAAAVARLH
jgi:hypothetical protein